MTQSKKNKDFLRYKDIPKEKNDPTGEDTLLNYDAPIRVWKSDELCAVLGNSQKSEVELNLEQVKADKIPIYKRSGGGGTVLLNPDGFCMGFRFKRDPALSIHDYFEMGTGVLAGVLKEQHNLDTKSRGISDLCIGDLKILGCSLFMPKNSVLYLASVLDKDNFDNIDKYLAHPSKEPDYRKGRNHLDFLTRISDHSSQGFEFEDWERHLTEYAETYLGDFLDYK